jgi:hypothetical protein
MIAAPDARIRRAAGNRIYVRHQVPPSRIQVMATGRELNRAQQRARKRPGECDRPIGLTLLLLGFLGAVPRQGERDGGQLDPVRLEAIAEPLRIGQFAHPAMNRFDPGETGPRGHLDHVIKFTRVRATGPVHEPRVTFRAKAKGNRKSCAHLWSADGFL